MILCHWFKPPLARIPHSLFRPLYWGMKLDTARLACSRIEACRLGNFQKSIRPKFNKMRRPEFGIVRWTSQSRTGAVLRSLVCVAASISLFVLEYPADARLSIIL